MATDATISMISACAAILAALVAVAALVLQLLGQRAANYRGELIATFFEYLRDSEKVVQARATLNRLRIEFGRSGDDVVALSRLQAETLQLIESIGQIATVRDYVHQLLACHLHGRFGYSSDERSLFQAMNQQAKDDSDSAGELIREISSFGDEVTNEMARATAALKKQASERSSAQSEQAL